MTLGITSHPQRWSRVTRVSHHTGWPTARWTEMPSCWASFSQGPTNCLVKSYTGYIGIMPTGILLGQVRAMYVISPLPGFGSKKRLTTYKKELRRTAVLVRLYMRTLHCTICCSMGKNFAWDAADLQFLGPDPPSIAGWTKRLPSLHCTAEWAARKKRLCGQKTPENCVECNAFKMLLVNVLPTLPTIFKSFKWKSSCSFWQTARSQESEVRDGAWSGGVKSSSASAHVLFLEHQAESSMIRCLHDSLGFSLKIY